MEHFRHIRTSCTALRAGFTLTELLVVISIISIIMAVVVNSQSSFNRTFTLANTARSVAFSFHTAQTFGLGGRAVGITRNAGHGLHFKSSAPNSFTFFSDSFPSPSLSSCHPTTNPSSPSALPGNCVYDATPDETIRTYTLGNRIVIDRFCVRGTSGWRCSTDTEGGLTSLDVVFSRPNPEPFISVNGVYSATYRITHACLSLTSPHGGARFISIGPAGDINANAPSCP